MAASLPARTYSRFIVAPDVWPTTREESEGRAAAQRHLATATAAAVDAHRVALHGLQAAGVAQSSGFEAMHAAYRRIQVRADDKAEADGAAADLMQSVAAIQMSAELMIDTIDAEAHQQLVHVPSRSPIAIGIITGAAARTRATAVGAADEIRALTVQFGQRFAPLPEGPPSGDPVGAGDDDRSTDKRSDESPERPPDAVVETGGTQTRHSAPDPPDANLSSGNNAPRVSTGPTPGSSSVSSQLSAQGTGPAYGAAVADIGSSGACLTGTGPWSSAGSMAALGGSASSLSGSGAGGMSHAGSVRPSASASSPSAVALQGVMHASAPAPLSSVAGTQTTTPAPFPAAASAAMQAPSPSGTSQPPIAATTGAVPVSIAGPQAVSSGGPHSPVAASLLPPGPLGPPPSASAAIAPATGAGPSVGGAHASMTPATASIAAAALTTPAATLPSRVAAAAARDLERQRNESSDLQMVKRLAWELLYATETCRSFALWAVGLMYSATGDRLIVALTHHGAGYVPAGVEIRRGVRMLWSDQAIGEGFRSRWTGNLDPAATLAAYAELKAAEPAGWRLAAAATTWSEVAALMTAAQRWGTEWATCSGMSMPASIEKLAAISDEDAPHRLEREFPELFERVAQLRARGLTHRAARLITEAIVSDARLAIVTADAPRIPSNFDSVWPVAADGRIDAADRAQFAEAVQQQWFSIGMVQPGWDDEPTGSACTEYRAQWLICRALEVVLGWIADGNSGAVPADLPMEDMIYAAAHAYLDGRGTGWITDLFDAAGA
uniref:Uncharacterized protein n=2 Tax=unclassified Mycobacterium TaxID=2642494 RepID=A0A5Q5BR12_MYCSS